MASSELLRRVVLVRTDVSEERIASIIRVTRIGELGTTLTVTSNRRNNSEDGTPDPTTDGRQLRARLACPIEGHTKLCRQSAGPNVRPSITAPYLVTSVNKCARATYVGVHWFLHISPADVTTYVATNPYCGLVWPQRESCITRSFIICTLRQV
jgi:hypothetical protein